ncbi:toprim domain-containing protein [Sphingobium yanoikuyae]|uniref:toprim domain-containing protein n=1 Tax=Sphingobium yanoikuyae TaxID=13690 RepID=UPI0022DE3FC9|nr:toprim domain-containing protein [Sphingobium yanoikuyae]WBQ17681.1 toprim domain-containing protein [Sphingobium yanoikuyae]
MVRIASRFNPELEAIGSDIVNRLGGIWKPGGSMCRCPAHADHSPSLSVRVGDHALLFKCFAGCDPRDVITEILRVERNALHHTQRDNVSTPKMPTDLWRRQQALRIWDEARPLIGTPAETYLRRRRIALLPQALRFHPRTPIGKGDHVDFRPAMIAALHDGGFHDEGRFVAIQRTFLDRDDARRARDLADPRMTLGRPDCAAVMLGTATSVLGLAEGVETALSAMILFGIPVWATLGSERLHQIAVPDRVTRLVLFPDNDVAGEIGAANALEVYAMAGRTIEVEYPPIGFKDWNDVLRAGGEGVGEWWRQVA